MRPYGKIASRFWTGTTGKALRAQGTEAQLVALYLLTAPTSNMIGLYYLPIPTLAHETGMSIDGASKALRRVCETGFAEYDDTDEMVWLPTLLRWECGDELKPGDKRVTGFKKAVRPYLSHRFYLHLYDLYGAGFYLPEPSPIDGASMAHRSQEQKQEQDHIQEADSEGAARLPARAHEATSDPGGPTQRGRLAIKVHAQLARAVEVLRDRGLVGRAPSLMGIGQTELLDRIRERAKAHADDMSAVEDELMAHLAVLVAEAEQTNDLKWLDGVKTWRSGVFARTGTTTAARVRAGEKLGAAGRNKPSAASTAADRAKKLEEQGL